MVTDVYELRFALRFKASVTFHEKEDFSAKNKIGLKAVQKKLF